MRTPFQGKRSPEHRHAAGERCDVSPRSWRQPKPLRHPPHRSALSRPSACMSVATSPARARNDHPSTLSGPSRPPPSPAAVRGTAHGVRLASRSLASAGNYTGTTPGLGEYSAVAWEWAGSADMCGGGTQPRRTPHSKNIFSGR